MKVLAIKEFPNQIFRTLQEKSVNKNPKTFTKFSEETFRKLNDAFNGIYYSPQSYDGPSNKKEHLSKINVLFADLDVAKSDDGQTQESIEKKKTALLKELQALSVPPSVVVATRNGIQPYWYVLVDDVDLNTVKRCESLIKSISEWAIEFGSLGDPVHDIVHLLRVPGFHHHKKEPYLVKVLSEQDVTYTLVQLEEVFPSVIKKENNFEYTAKGDVSNPIFEKVNSLDIRDVVIRVWAHLGRIATFDKDNHLILDGQPTATFANREGKNFIATSSSEYPADGNSITYVAETLDISTKEAFAWIVENFDLKSDDVSRQSIKSNTEATTSGTNKNSKSPSQAETLIRLIESEETEFFKNETNDAFARVKVQDHFEIHPVKSKAFKLWAIGLYYKHAQGGAINSDAYQTARGIIEGRCIFGGNQYTIHPRVGREEDVLWYDLCDSKWRAVRIDEHGWNIVNTPPILFRRYQHMHTQMEPRGSLHLREIFEFINVENEDMKLLLMVWIVTSFIKGFPHVAPIIHGQQGSAKTTASEILKAIIDPSVIKTARLPHDIKETVQMLAHSWFTIFDNVSPDKFPGSTSDLFCTVITGGGVSKRELHTDDEDIIYNLQRVIGINGIVIVANKPDLLDRSVLIELARIPEEKRKSANEVAKQFSEKLPAILGGIFDTLVQAIQIKKTLTFTSLPRMADFAEWGSAIAIALGYTQEQFLTSYKNNIQQQSDTVIDDSLVATLVLALCERQEEDEWEGTASELLEELGKNEEGVIDEKIRRSVNFPKASNVLSRDLNELKTTLAEAGCYVWQTGTNRKKWHISKKPENKEVADLFFISKKDDEHHKNTHTPENNERALDIPLEPQFEESTNKEDVW